MVSTRVAPRKNGKPHRASMRRIARSSKKALAVEKETKKRVKTKIAEKLENLTDLERIELMDAEKRRALLNKNGDRRGVATPLTELRQRQFGPHNKPPGRKGAPNRIPSELVVAIIAACEAVGYDKEEDPTQHVPGLIPYLTRSAELHRVEYLKILEKLLPNMVHFLANVNGHVTTSRYETLEEAREALRARGMPVDGLLLQAMPAPSADQTNNAFGTTDDDAEEA
jgi:hypothetical protein